MKVTFEFNLPKETSEYNIFQDAVISHSNLWNIHELCCDTLNGDIEATVEEAELAREILKLITIELD